MLSTQYCCWPNFPSLLWFFLGKAGWWANLKICSQFIHAQTLVYFCPDYEMFGLTSGTRRCRLWPFSPQLRMDWLCMKTHLWSVSQWNKWFKVCFDCTYTSAYGWVSYLNWAQTCIILDASFCLIGVHVCIILYVLLYQNELIGKIKHVLLLHFCPEWEVQGLARILCLFSEAFLKSVVVLN